MDAAPPEHPSSGPRGLSEPLLRYLEARGVLLTVEAQEALQHVLRLAIFGAIAGLAAFIGWLLITAALLSFIIDKTGWHWMKASLVLGAVHLGVALVFYLALRNRLGGVRFFPDTLNEFKKDRAWLARPTRKS